MAFLARQQPSIRIVGQHARGMATEKQILMRINSTANISKITKSMKMVSAAKMRGAQNRLTNGRPFSAWLDNISGKPRVLETDGLLPEEEGEKNNMLVVVSSDRGLCGGVNSIISRNVKSQISKWSNDDKHGVFVIGDKGRAQLRRAMSEKISGSVSDCWSISPSFAMASSIAEGMLISIEEKKIDQVSVVYNAFKSAIAYHPSMRTLPMTTGDEESLSSYEFEPDNMDELMEDLKEFQVASAIFHAMIENATSEESSRMSAMENATKNAGELIDSLTIVYNKARQTRITTELIEIISGASSLDDASE